MEKKNIFELAIHFIVLATFNGIVYLLSKWDFTISQIISYVMINIAYVIFAFTPSVGQSEKNKVETKTPLLMLASVYMVAMFAVGIISMLIFKNNYTIPVVLYILIHAIYTILLLVVLRDNDRIIKSEQKK